MARVAVLLSTYNGEDYLSQQIDSILNQTIVDDITLFIRDDGSTDNTRKILEKYKNSFPNKINIFLGENIGLNFSFFWLIHNVDGFDFYSICDQDDVWLNNKIEIAVEMLKKEDNSIPLLYASSSFLVHNDLIPYGETRKKNREITIYNSLIQNFSPGHSQVFNDKLHELLNCDFNVTNIYVYDSWILNEAILFGKLIFDNNSHTFYRQHDDNQLGSGKSNFQKLLLSKKRINKGHGKKYRQQIEYFNDYNSLKMKDIGAYDYVKKFVSKKNFFTRFAFSMSGRFYRQKKIETFAFYLAYIFGKF